MVVRIGDGEGRLACPARLWPPEGLSPLLAAAPSFADLLGDRPAFGDDLFSLASAQIHPSCLPTWLAAVGTVGALGAALWQIGAERSAATSARRKNGIWPKPRLITAVVGPEE